LTVHPLQLSLAGGQVATDFEADATQDPLHLALAARIHKVQLGQLLAPFLADSGATDEKVGKLKPKELFTGTLAGRIDLKMNGASLKDLVASSNGNIGLLVEDGRMSSLIVEGLGLDVTQAIEVLFHRKREQTFKLNCLIASVEAKEGELVPKVLLASTSDSDIIVTGGVDLRKETIDLLIRTEPKDFSIGSVRTPLTIKGPLSQMKVGVVREELGARLAAAVGLGVFVNPIAALIPLIEPGLEKNGKCNTYIAEIDRIKSKERPATAH
jgi:uncharacterized protein involved in outer membrane biogenesis